MRKVAVLIPSYKSAEWLAIALHHFKTYGIPVEHELVVVDNSPDHPSIRAAKETCLGEGVKFVKGRRDFPSHAYGYKLAYDATDADWIFTAETDSFPTRHGWFDPYIKLCFSHDLIGPEMPMASGTFIHPAGALYSRKLLDAHKAWCDSIHDWAFVPGAGISLGVSDKGYHVVARKDWLSKQPVDLKDDIDLWSDVGPWQEMRSFDDDTFEGYGQRTEIKNWNPDDTREWYLKIGYEPGQHLSYFANSPLGKMLGFRTYKAPVDIQWMSGHEGRQAAYSTIFDGFRHIWGGTVCEVSGQNMNPSVVSSKRRQMDELHDKLPDEVRAKIKELKQIP